MLWPADLASWRHSSVTRNAYEDMKSLFLKGTQGGSLQLFRTASPPSPPGQGHSSSYYSRPYYDATSLEVRLTRPGVGEPVRVTVEATREVTGFELVGDFYYYRTGSVAGTEVYDRLLVELSRRLVLPSSVKAHASFRAKTPREAIEAVTEVFRALLWEHDALVSDTGERGLQSLDFAPHLLALVDSVRTEEEALRVAEALLLYAESMGFLWPGVRRWARSEPSLGDREAMHAHFRVDPDSRWNDRVLMHRVESEIRALRQACTGILRPLGFRSSVSFRARLPGFLRAILHLGRAQTFSAEGEEARGSRHAEVRLRSLREPRYELSLYDAQAGVGMRGAPTEQRSLAQYLGHAREGA